MGVCQNWLVSFLAYVEIDIWSKLVNIVIFTVEVGKNQAKLWHICMFRHNYWHSSATYVGVRSTQSLAQVCHKKMVNSMLSLVKIEIGRRILAKNCDAIAFFTTIIGINLQKILTLARHNHWHKFVTTVDIRRFASAVSGMPVACRVVSLSHTVVFFSLSPSVFPPASIRTAIGRCTTDAARYWLWNAACWLVKIFNTHKHTTHTYC